MGYTGVELFPADRHNEQGAGHPHQVEDEKPSFIVD